MIHSQFTMKFLSIVLVCAMVFGSCFFSVYDAPASFAADSDIFMVEEASDEALETSEEKPEGQTGRAGGVARQDGSSISTDKENIGQDGDSTSADGRHQDEDPQAATGAESSEGEPAEDGPRKKPDRPVADDKSFIMPEAALPDDIVPANELLDELEETLLDVVYLNGASGKDTNDGGTAETAVKTFAKAKALLAQDGTVYITGKVSISANDEWNMSDNPGAVIMRHETYLGDMIAFGSTNKALILTTVTLDGGAVEGTTGSIINLEKNGSSLTVDSGSVLRNNVTLADGAAISVSAGSNAARTAVYVTGGSVITGNESIGQLNDKGIGASGFGGGIYTKNQYATINIDGASAVTDNTALYGGGIYASGPVDLSGGAVVADNMAGYVNPNGKDSASTSIYGGGGLYMAGSSATLTMAGAGTTVSGNFSYDAGGGIYAKGNVNMTGGATVKDNSCNSFGGGVYFYAVSSTLTIEGYGSGICQNAAVQAGDIRNGGGGLYAVGNVELLNGAALSGNASDTNGGGLYYSGASCRLAVSGARIENNTSAADGGGMYLNAVKAAEIQDGTVFGGNTAQGNGGGLGISAANRSKLNISSGVEFRGNRASAGTVDADGAYTPAKVTKPFTNVYNNYDLQNTTGTQVQVITYYLNDGSDAIYQAVFDGAEQPANPQRSGYQFKGWYLEQECNTPFSNGSQPVDSYLDLYAKWEEGAGNITVAYHLNNETETVKAVEMAPGDSVTEPEAPTRDSYRFLGWYTAPTEGIAFVFGEPATESLDLYARWVKTYTVTFYLGYLSGNNDLHQRQTVDENTAAKAPEPPAREGYNFTGWFENRQGEGSAHTFADPVTDDLTLYAAWEPDRDFSTVYLGGSGSDDNSGTAPDTPFRTFAKALAAVEADGTIYVTGQITLSTPEHWDGAGKNITVKRYETYYGYLVQVNEGGRLVLTDITLDGNRSEVDSRETISAMLRAYNGGSITVGEGARLQNNLTTTGYSGGAINVLTDYQGTVRSQLTVEMGAVFENNRFAGHSEGSGAIYGATADIAVSDASFIDNQTTLHGGAIFLKTDGTMAIYGTAEKGTFFTGNEAGADGGALLLENSRLTVEGKVTFCGNTAGDNGGAMRVTINSTADLHGPEVVIENNTAGKNGGAIYVAHCPLNIYDGVKITGNTAENSGGAIYAFGLETLITGSSTVISGNRAKVAGGGIYVSDVSSEERTGQPLNMTVTGGAQVLENLCGSQGGGIYIQRNVQLVVSGGAAVRQNSAGLAGGGVYAINDCYLTVSGDGTEITDNEAAVGGGVYAVDNENGLYRETVIHLTDSASLHNNRAISGNGGGIYANNSTTVRVDGGAAIAGNTSSEKGGGMYIYSGRAELSGAGVEVRDNSAKNGGGIYVATALKEGTGTALSVLVLTDGAAISGNQAVSNGNGGGVYLEEEAYVELVNRSMMTGNTAENNGGGIYAEKNSRGTISTGAVSSSNSAYRHGGAAYSEGNLVIREGIVLEGNSAGAYFFAKASASQEDVASIGESVPSPDDSTVGNGGAIYIESGRLAILAGAEIRENMADFGGGVYIDPGADYVYITGDEPDAELLQLLEIKAEEYDDSYEGLQMTENVVRYDGGGIYTHRLDILTVDNVTFTSNLARETVGSATLEELGDLLIELLHGVKILNVSSYSDKYEFAYNNYDINFIDSKNMPFWALVLFHTNYGEDEIHETELFFTKGEEQIVVPAVEPEQEGYDFTGWYADPQGTELYGFQEDFTDSETVVHVYAGWETGAETKPPGGGGSGGSGAGGGKGSTGGNEKPVETVDLTTNHFAYLVGYPDGTIRPEANVTRAEVATIFFRMLTDEARQRYWSRTSGYSDVEFSGWYNNAVSTMENGGYLSGYEDGTFRPDDKITRAELAAIAVRFLKDGDRTETAAFTDVSGHWAEDAISRAAAAGWISGYPDGTFRPDEPILRAEVATIMNHVLVRLPDSEDDLLSGMIRWPDNPGSAWYYLSMQEATNSHYYVMRADGTEKWLSFRAAPDWVSLERGDFIPVSNYLD